MKLKMNYMKFILFFLLFLSYNGNAQQSNTHYDSIKQYLKEDYYSRLLIVYEDGKQGVYNKSRQEFSIDPTFDLLEYSSYYEKLVGVNGETKTITMFDYSDFRPFVIDTFPISSKNCIILSSFFTVKYKEVEELQKLIVDTDTVNLIKINRAKAESKSDSNTLVGSSSNDTIKNFESQFFGMTFFNDTLIYMIEDKYELYLPFAETLKSRQYPDEDSLLMDDAGFELAIYPSCCGAYGKSGVYDLKNRKWLIERKCFEILFHDELITYSFYGKVKGVSDFYKETLSIVNK